MSDEEGRHVSIKQLSEIFSALQETHGAMRRAADLSWAIVLDKEMCCGCRNDAAQTNGAVLAAAQAIQALEEKIARKLFSVGATGAEGERN